MVVLAGVLSTALGACSATSPTPAPTATSGPLRAQFLHRARPLLPDVPDRSLTDLAVYVCDQVSTNGDGDARTEITVQRSAPVEVSTAAANDFMQAAVLWECASLYQPGDFRHPDKYHD